MVNKTIRPPPLKTVFHLIELFIIELKLNAGYRPTGYYSDEYLIRHFMNIFLIIIS